MSNELIPMPVLSPGASLEAYVQAVNGIPILTAEREQELAASASTHDLLEFIHNARNSFSDLIDRSGEPAAGAVLKALIIGDRTQITPELRQAFNRAGVGHLLAISGLHIGIVATVAFVLLQVHS